MIKAEIVADSVNPQGDRLTSLLITFPRIILAEVNTHRMLSKNTSSSRAIPFNKMVEAVQENPFIPIAWQKEHKGMQGSEYFTDTKDIQNNIQTWLVARDYIIKQAQGLNDYYGVTKQLCNRLLEPFMWTTMLITGSKEGWDNFFELRCPQYQVPHTTFVSYQKSWKEVIKYAEENFEKEYIENIKNTSLLAKLSQNKGQAEIHMMALAECIYDAMNESTPKQLQAGEYHIPFEDKISSNVMDWSNNSKIQAELWGKDLSMYKVKVSTAMAARTSYTVVGDEPEKILNPITNQFIDNPNYKKVNYQKMIELHDRLIAQNPPHSSPMEHCARAMSMEEYESFIKGQINWHYDMDSDKEILDFVPIENQGWCRNFKGFIQYRHLIETNNATD